MQPEDELPDLIIVDEPELGLHPYALNVVASLFNKVSHHTQVLISTQSSSFLDNFDGWTWWWLIGKEKNRVFEA